MSTESTQPDLASLRIHREEPTANIGPPSRRKKWIWGSSLVIVIVVAFIWFMQTKTDSTTVQVAPVQRIAPAAAQSILTAAGYVVAQRKAAVASKGTGRLEVLNVEEGDQVKAGEVIGRLESDDVDAALASARAAAIQADAEWDRAKAILHEAKLNYDRLKGLLGASLASQAEYDHAEAQYRTAEAGVNSAKAGFDRARADVDYAQVAVENTYIRAPFDGTVLTKSADVGEVVAPFAASSSSRGALVTLADMTSLEVEADVSESNIQKVFTGQPCVIVLDAQPADPYSGHVKKIVPTADRSKATVMTKIAFDELDDRVLPEMSAKVNFLPNDGAGSRDMQSGTVLVVPNGAVTERKGRTVVFCVSRNKVSEVEVATGKVYGGTTEVQGGLSAGDVVVLDPNDDLTDGDAVELAE